MNTDTLTQLLTDIRSHARKLAIAWLDGEQGIGTFWEEAESFVGVRWDELLTADQDSLVDAFGGEVKAVVVERATRSDSGEWVSTRGATLIFAKEAASPASSSSQPLHATDPVKASPEGSVCEVELLGEFDERKLVFRDGFNAECVLEMRGPVNSIQRTWVALYVSGCTRMSLPRSQVSSLIAHLTAWLETGSFKLVPRAVSPSTDQSSLLREAREVLEEAGETLWQMGRTMPEKSMAREWCDGAEKRCNEVMSKLNTALGEEQKGGATV